MANMTTLHREILKQKKLGIEMKEICKNLNTSMSTVSRVWKKWKNKAEEIEEKLELEVLASEVIKEKEMLQELTGPAWNALKEALSATKLYGKEGIVHPDFAVRLNAARLILSAAGLVVEKKETKHSGEVNVDMKEKLIEATKEGIERYGYTLDHIDPVNPNLHN